MGWETDLFAFLDDLEQQAAALYDAERAPELADRSRAEYRQVTLAARLMASLEREVQLSVTGTGQLVGPLGRVGDGWCLLRSAGADWVVALGAVESAAGLSERAVPEVAWPATSRLGLASALRRLAEAGERCVLHRRSGAVVEGVLHRVGADFVEVAEASGRLSLVALDAVAAVQSRE